MDLLLDKTVVHAKSLQTMQESNLKLATAVILMFITIASFVVMAVAGRYVSDELDTFEIYRINLEKQIIIFIGENCV